MSVALPLLFHRVRDPRIAAWISLAVLLVVVGLLVFVELVGLMSPGHWPANEAHPVGPFRWAPPEGA